MISAELYSPSTLTCSTSRDAQTSAASVFGYTPVQAHTYGSATATTYGNMTTAHGSSTTYCSGGQPIIAGTLDQGLVVKMFRDGDPAGSNAIPARLQLGPQWEEIVKQGPRMTCG